MDRTDEYRAIVKRLLQEVADMTPEENIRTEFVCDDALGHYQVGQVGWENKRRVDDVFLHIDVVDGKVWLQHDDDLRIAEDLIALESPRSISSSPSIIPAVGPTRSSPSPHFARRYGRRRRWHKRFVVSGLVTTYCSALGGAF